MLTTITQQVATTLHSQHHKLVTAESCTGGWIAKLLTDIPGSSAWFERGFVTYSNAAKQESLGVPLATLTRYGAVSQETVCAMAQGALRQSYADIALAVSGIAGPGGGSENKPVGLVWLAWAGTNADIHSQHYVFQGDRNAIREQAVHAALKGLLNVINNVIDH